MRDVTRDAMSPAISSPHASVELPPENGVERTPLLIIGTGRASMTLVAHLPERALVGAVVVDPSGEWLESWALRVMAMGATHVRSALSMTPFPDADGLRAFCEKRGNRKEDVLAGTDDRPPVPSCRAYAEYCGSRVRRDSKFRRVRVIADRVVRLDPEPGGGLRATLASGDAVVAAQVAHGAARRVPVVPSWITRAMQERKGESGDAKGASKKKDATLAVAADVDLEACDLERRDVVVVGGGSTAFTLAAAASRRGAARVTVVSRGEVTVRDRECDVAFYGNKGIGAFRGAPHPETRVASLRAETRASADERTFAAAADAGAAVLEGCVVERATRCETTGKWRLLVAARDAEHAEGGRVRDVDDTDVLDADFVWAACGEAVDASKDPVLKSLSDRDDSAGRIVGGFPVLVEDDDASDASDAPGTAKDGKGAASPEAIGPLRWPGLPLYFVGRYASLSVGPAAGAPAGHRVAARAVALAVRAHAARWRRGQNPYAQGLSAAQTKGSAQTTTRQTDAEGVPLALRLVPEHLRGGRSLMDARELARALRGAADGPSPRGKGGLLVPSSSADTLAMRDLAQYQTIDDDFVLEVRLPLPERVPPEKVRVAFEARSVEVFAIGDKITYRFFVPKLFKPVLVERCRYEVAKSGKRVSLFLHKYDNNEWRFLKG